ncbi:sugar phosphate isomerase/epimerase [Novosphingobium sp. PP1Y]|uniref:sugar phosphate isomerase/epimerase family protein n=1 Tax=Novosphingobium sp. PP1Y TaxID=702113 RepID=UPI00020EF744|nr:sugar phosphate isomerase/epimerase [Novosphingobium sp. PP1Y]CCA90141.1 xylose isomerase domain-containing protein [Novosphingobium sp. PP1Y]
MKTITELVFCSPALPDVPLLDRLAPVAAAGFTALSLMPGDVWTLEETGMAAPEIAARIADAGLKVAELDCTACWMPRQRTQGDSDPLAQFLRGLTPDKVVATAARIGAASLVAVDLSNTPAPLDEAAESFAELCDHAAEHDLPVQIEFLPVGGIRTLSEAWAIVEAAGRANGGLTIDAWHFFRSGSTLDQLAKIPSDRIHTVQLCDAPVLPQGDLWTELMTARLLPGEGALDLAGLVRTLDGIGSSAPMGVEVFNIRQNNQSCAQVARDWANAARSVLAKARGVA